MTDLNIDAISAMDADEIARRLSGPAEERGAFIRIAAEAGVADAQALYGQLLLDGDGVPQDQQDAVRWFDRAARQGHVMAMNMMGRCYDLGWGVAIDKVRASQWFKAASDRGLEWGMYNYATALTLGAGVPEDRPAALALFAAIGGLAVVCLRGVRRRHRDWAYPALGVAASVLVGVHALLDFSLQIPAVAILYACIMGVGCAQAWSSRE